jgi:hypothetical protein
MGRSRSRPLLCSHVCILNFADSPSQLQLQALFGSKLQNIVELQLHSCCFVNEHPYGSGSLLLQGSHDDIAEAVQLILQMIATKRLSIKLDLGKKYNYMNIISHSRHPAPFQTHGIGVRPLPESSSPASSSAITEDSTSPSAPPATFVYDSDCSIRLHPL